MAAILSVTYTPNYTGCHRICFKTTQASYCCYQDDSPSEIGVEKITVIDLTLYAECLVDVPFQIGCNDTNLIGYVQPCCTDATSLDNRVSFATTYETTPCTTYNVECTESGIGEVTINNPGYGWPVGVTPTITISDSSGIGSGFVGTVVMDCVPGENFCSIGSIVTDDPGVDYHFLNTLSVDISPLPSCESNNLIIDGNFVNGFLDWNVGPVVGSWLLTPSMVPYYNIPVYSSTGGTLEQVILTPGRTYLIDFEKVIVQARSGTVRFIVTAGLFSITGTASNQYMIALNSGDPDYDGPLSITLTCFGSSVFSIYADSSTTDVLNKASLTAVSVIELCEVIDPDLEVTLLDDCGTFTVPDCYGNDNPTTYKLWGGAAGISNINVCSGGAGPVGPKYNVTPNPAVTSYGPELVDFSPTGNLTFYGDIQWDGIGTGPFPVEVVSLEGSSYVNLIVIPGILNPGSTYQIQLNAFTEVVENTISIYAGTNSVSVGPFLGYTPIGVTYTVVSNGTDIQIIIPSVVKNTYLGSLSIVEVISTPISCCDCIRHFISVSVNPISVYYTDCNQNIQIYTIDNVTLGEVCAVPGSIFPVNPDDNVYILSIIPDASCNT